MGAEYLIDTNAASDFLVAALPPAGQAFLASLIDAIPKISVVTQIELLVWAPQSSAAAAIQSFVADCNILNLTQDIITRAVGVRTRHRLKLPDAIIAATALANDLALVTRNMKDFGSVSGLRCINPWEL